ncbi:MAG: ribosomal L7Ae/L30e/S12e/Gadd45 family protein [Lachnospiraceae bacterium]|nr:ribosomal L7Ae/L30e/S12e/Gadd45 family protein [Lachnospiraceae bacterium]
MKQDRLLSLLGLAQRAGKIKSGNYAVEQSVKTGAACLVIMTCDTSDASKKHIRDMCTYYETTCREYADKERLGAAIGKEFRSVLSVEDSGFCKSILALLDQEQ